MLRTKPKLGGLLLSSPRSANLLSLHLASLYKSRSYVLASAHLVTMHNWPCIGWHKGARRAVIIAGRKYPKYIVSGLTEYPDPGIVSEEDQLTFGVTPPLPLAHQIVAYKYVINVDGWCGSKRMKQLLASDSAILSVVSWEEEWYTPLLVPGKHYIPVRFEASDPHLDDGTELLHRIKWAQKHPDEVAKIVQHAKSFHDFYLSQRGEQCFAVQLLEEYSGLLLDSWKLRSLAAAIGSS